MEPPAVTPLFGIPYTEQQLAQLGFGREESLAKKIRTATQRVEDPVSKFLGTIQDQPPELRAQKLKALYQVNGDKFFGKVLKRMVDPPDNPIPEDLPDDLDRETCTVLFGWVTNPIDVASLPISKVKSLFRVLQCSCDNAYQNQNVKALVIQLAKKLLSQGSFAPIPEMLNRQLWDHLTFQCIPVILHASPKKLISAFRSAQNLRESVPSIIFEMYSERLFQFGESLLDSKDNDTYAAVACLPLLIQTSRKLSSEKHHTLLAWVKRMNDDPDIRKSDDHLENVFMRWIYNLNFPHLWNIGLKWEGLIGPRFSSSLSSGSTYLFRDVLLYWPELDPHKVIYSPGKYLEDDDNLTFTERVILAHYLKLPFPDKINFDMLKALDYVDRVLVLFVATRHPEWESRPRLSSAQLIELLPHSFDESGEAEFEDAYTLSLRVLSAELEQQRDTDLLKHMYCIYSSFDSCDTASITQKNVQAAREAFIQTMASSAEIVRRLT